MKGYLYLKDFSLEILNKPVQRIKNIYIIYKYKENKNKIGEEKERYRGKE